MLIDLKELEFMQKARVHAVDIMNTPVFSMEQITHLDKIRKEMKTKIYKTHSNY